MIWFNFFSDLFLYFIPLHPNILLHFQLLITAAMFFWLPQTPICTHLTPNFFTGNSIVLVCGTGNKARWVCITSYTLCKLRPQSLHAVLNWWNRTIAWWLDWLGLPVPKNPVWNSALFRISSEVRHICPRHVLTPTHFECTLLGICPHRPPAQHGRGRPALILLHFHIFTLLVYAHPRGWMEWRKTGRKSIIFWQHGDLCARSPGSSLVLVYTLIPA